MAGGCPVQNAIDIVIRRRSGAVADIDRKRGRAVGIEIGNFQIATDDAGAGWKFTELGDDADSEHRRRKRFRKANHLDRLAPETGGHVRPVGQIVVDSWESHCSLAFHDCVVEVRD